MALWASGSKSDWPITQHATRWRVRPYRRRKTDARNVVTTPVLLAPSRMWSITRERE